MPKLWQQAISAVLAILFTALVPLSTASADTKPYFRTLNGGPFAGGWFNSGIDSCSTSTDYQSPFVGPGPNQYYRGAIMGWSDLGTPRGTGASSNLDAFATGLIEGKGSPDFYGFYTGLAGNNPLSLANVNSFSVSNFWGGVLEGAAGGEHCVPDYYGTKQVGVPPAWTGSFAAVSPTNQFIWSGGSLSGTVPAGKTVIIFVNGNVNITGNITYEPHDITNVPKFALVVRGDIRISSTVTQLDGWYIAQPTSGTTRGVIWTCNNGTDTIPDTFIRSNCNGRLTINGALTAKQVNLARINGNLGSSSAEDVNFSAAMVLGGPFFEAAPGGGGGSTSAGAIQSLISLPPVF